MNVVRLSAVRTGTHFCYRLSRPQGQSAGGRIYVTIRNKTCDLPVCSAVPQPNSLPRAPVPCSKQFTIFAVYKQKDATFYILFISVTRSTYFRRFFRPSSGAQNCTYSVRYSSGGYCYLLLAWPG